MAIAMANHKDFETMRAKGTADLIKQNFNLTEVRRLWDCIKDTLRGNYSGLSSLQIDEIVEAWEEKVCLHLREYINECNKKGAPPRFFFSESDPDLLVGYCYILKSDSPEKIKEKLRFRFVDDIKKTVSSLTPSQFEELCGALLIKEDFPQVWLTCDDGGADIFAKDRFGRACVGSVKHYVDYTQPSVIRDLLGTVTHFERELGIKLFPILFTAGYFAVTALEEYAKENIIVYEGDKISYLIIKHQIGFIENQEGKILFYEAKFNKQLSTLSPAHATFSEIENALKRY